MHKSAKLHRARVVKNDEFYTQYDDVKKECDNYMPHFFNKVIYCNCDTDDSAFVKYFLDLKARGKIRDVIWSGGLGGLDFRSDAAVALLKRADIIVTNPPFSLFREFIDLLMENDKKFLAIGNKNAIGYKTFFNLIKESKVHTGVRRFREILYFSTPDDPMPTKDIPAVWFTNLSHNFMRPYLATGKKYSDNKFVKYDNADAINIDKVKDIPMDYFGTMGVPITFIDKYNPDQFEILGLDRDYTTDRRGLKLNGRDIYHRIFIRRKK